MTSCGGSYYIEAEVASNWKQFAVWQVVHVVDVLYYPEYLTFFFFFAKLLSIVISMSSESNVFPSTEPVFVNCTKHNRLIKHLTF